MDELQAEYQRKFHEVEAGKASLDLLNKRNVFLFHIVVRLWVLLSEFNRHCDRPRRCYVRKKNRNREALGGEE